MADINPQIPIAGQPDATEEPKIVTALQTLVASFNGLNDDLPASPAGITARNLSAGVQDAVGLNGAATRRGHSFAAGEVTTSSGTPVTLAGDSTITVTQPVGGVTMIYVQAELNATNYAGVSVQIDGGTNCLALSSIATSYTTVYSCPGDPTGTPDLLTGGWLVVSLAGAHSYRLAYSATLGASFFRNRQLSVVTLGF